jgi:hypothetical protein
MSLLRQMMGGSMMEAETEAKIKGSCFRLEGKSLQERNDAEMAHVRNASDPNCTNFCKQSIACFKLPMPVSV